MLHAIPRFLTALFAASLLLFGAAASAAPTTPTADFTDNNDGTVTHKTTGLTWKRCSEGQTWSGGTCAGTAATYTWAQAVALTSSFAGKSDWRLPNIRELLTITETEAYVPAINDAIFPNPPASHFWSASAYVGGPGGAWFVNFGNGYGHYTNSKTSAFQVRLVRGGQSLGLLALNRPMTDYVDKGDGTVTHTPTQLTWKRCAEGQTWSGGTCTGTATGSTWAAATAMTGLFAGKSDWRLPTLTELRSLVDFTRCCHTINDTIFPNTPVISEFWSASSYAGDSDDAWYVGFFNGFGASIYKTAAFQVRLVRGGQLFGSLVSLGLSCPSILNAGASGLCSATATYSDGNSKGVTPSWSLSGNAATLDNSGNLTGGTVSSDTPVTVTATYAEGGITKTAEAKVTVSAAPPPPSSACSGSDKNLSAITIAGNATKRLGDPLEVNYCLKNFNSATKFDIYVAVQLPDRKTLLFLQAAGFFQTVSFTPQVAPYLANILIPDKSGPVLSIPVLPLTLPTGTYTFYAIPVRAGDEVMNFTTHVGVIAKELVNLNE